MWQTQLYRTLPPTPSFRYDLSSRPLPRHHLSLRQKASRPLGTDSAFLHRRDTNLRRPVLPPAPILQSSVYSNVPSRAVPALPSANHDAVSVRRDES
jgi:hypothetical protein